MRHQFPNITPSAPIDARKVTRANLDNVANALLNIINTSPGITQPSTLASVTVITYNRIQVMFNENPSLTLNELKLSRKWFIEYLRGDNIGNPGLKAWHWDTVNSYPIFLSAFIDLLKTADFSSNPNRIFAIRIAIALLSLDRVMIIDGKPSYGTITTVGDKINVNSTYYPSSVEVLINRLGFDSRSFKERYDLECSTFRYTVLSSAGVNGDATWTAHSDARALLLNKEVLAEVKSFAVLSGLERVFNDLLSCIEIETDRSLDRKGLKVGRLHSFVEWGGKVRTVAIVDYWTQMLLTPLHNTINHFLRRIEMDGTFNQDKLALKVQEWTRSGTNQVYSYDLSAATDRLPISLQVDILTALLGNASLASAWAKMLVNRDFTTEDGQALRYAVGQPMGARSSFPMLALTHHLIVQHAARLYSDDPFVDYVILGDDMTLTNTKISENYLNIMQELGVTINLSKSVVHRDGLVSAGEICKRVYLAGEEITAISPKLIAKCIKNGSLAPTLQDDLARRGVKLSGDFVSRFFYTLVDQVSFKELMILNSLPSTVSGLANPVLISGLKISNIENWYPGLKGFDENTVRNVFTYTAALEALKRLDALLRQTLAIGTAIAEKYGSYYDSPVNVKTLWEILGIPTDITSDIVNSLSLNLTTIKPCHPIIRASEAEIERVTELLSGLISVDIEMYNRSRNGLLDIVRNALVDIWSDNDDARAAGGRTLLNKSLANVKALVAKGTKIDERCPNHPTYNPSEMVLEYSIMLTQIQRHWNIRVTLTDGVLINAVKSRIPLASSIIATKVNSALSNITI